jgi:hypothetical protein
MLMFPGMLQAVEDLHVTPWPFLFLSPYEATHDNISDYGT